MLKKFFGFLVVLFLTSGCSLHTFMPANRFDFPETHGEWLWGRAQIRYQGTTRIELVPDFVGSTPILDQPKLVPEEPSLNTFALSLDSGVWKKFDIFLKMPMGPSPTLLGVKYQILGPLYDKRKKHDLSLSVTLAGGYGRQDAKKTEDGVDAQLKTTSLAMDVATIAGFRLRKDLQIYGGPFYSSVNVSGEISQPTQTFTFEQGGYQMGLNLGMHYTEKDYGAALEVALIDLNWSHARKLTRHFFGASVSKEF